MKKTSLIAISALLALLMIFSACGETPQTPEQEAATPTTPTEQQTVCSSEMLQDFSTWTQDEYYTLQLNGDSVISNATSIETTAARVIITEAGTYLVTGKLDDAQIVVNVPGDGVVKLVLSDVTLHYSIGPAIEVKSAGMAVIILPEGTASTISDEKSYLLSNTETEPDAAIYSKDDLVLTGGGSLTVTGNFQNAVTGKDDVAVTGGNYTITAVNNGIKGKDSVVVTAGTLNISSGNDAIKSTNTTDTEKGNVLIQGGALTLIAGCDGIQAANTATVTGGTLSFVTGGGSANASSGTTAEDWGSWGGRMPGDTALEAAAAPATTAATGESTSAKGIKATSAISITGGTLTFDTSDDAIHSNGNITVSGGTIKISSGDDGIHADSTITIEGGNISIDQSYEGIEGNNITMNGGTVNVTSRDDGLNAAGGSDSSGVNRPGAGTFSRSSNCLITIAGGTLRVNASGDGIDSNGSILVTGGQVFVDGPSDSGNAAIDYGAESGGTCSITGGTVLAIGGSGMAENFDSNSTQCSFIYNISGSAGSIISIKDASGNALLQYTAAKSFSNVVFSSPDLQLNATYTLSVGSYSVEITLTSVSTGTSGGMGGGQKPSGGRMAEGTIPDGQMERPVMGSAPDTTFSATAKS